MVEVRVGNLLRSQSQTLTNTVNCVGIMGKGIALQFRDEYPTMFRDYVARCKRREVRLGEPYLFRPLIGPWVLNFPTKDHWRGVANLNDIVRGLEFLIAHYREWGITSLAVPPLGCGNGQLEWNIVGPTLFRHLSNLEIPVELFAPPGTPHDQLTSEFLTLGSGGPNERSLPKTENAHVPPAFIALVAVVDYITRRQYNWPVGRVMFQKLAYFATEFGLPTGLAFQKASYGPYSPELKKMVARLLANGLLTEERLGNMIAVRPGPTFQDARKAYVNELHSWSGTQRRLIDLMSRMRTDDAELAASVHFASTTLSPAADLDALSELDVFHSVMDWKKRRRPPLDEVKLADTIRGLNMLGVVKLQPSQELPITDDGLTYT